MGGKSNQKREPTLPAGTCAECDKLVAAATKLLAEVPPEFLPAKQQAEFRKKNLDKAAKQCRAAIESSPDGFDAAGAQLLLDRITHAATPSAQAGPGKKASTSSAVAELRYRWVDPLPSDATAALSEMGVVAGAELTAADLKGIKTQGGPAVAIECGLIEPISEAEGAADAASAPAPAAATKSRRRGGKKAKGNTSGAGEPLEDEDALLAAAMAEGASVDIS